MRVRCEIRPEMRKDVLEHPERFGEVITAGHEVLGEESESIVQHPYALVVQDFFSYWIKSYPVKSKSADDTNNSVQRTTLPGRIYTVLWSSFVLAMI